jgi:WD40 repeat protein
MHQDFSTLCPNLLACSYISNSHPVNSIKISADGRFIVSADDDGKIEIWHLDSGQLIHAIKGHNKIARSVAISPDGWTIASGSYSNTVKIWRVSP